MDQLLIESISFMYWNLFGGIQVKSQLQNSTWLCIMVQTFESMLQVKDFG